MTARETIYSGVSGVRSPKGVLARTVLGFDRGHAGARTGSNCTTRSPEGKPGWTARHAGPAGSTPGHGATPKTRKNTMTQTERSPSAASSATTTAITWISGLTLLATVIAVIVLALTGNRDYLAPVIGLGATAAATGGTVQVRIHIRR
ncbi:hypothetical protein [Streptomyces mirabilis]|uniref:hypothetical protein n=1 Tax=Streptomyces mirabilis TaxID=68239 RepID=UPI0034065633